MFIFFGTELTKRENLIKRIKIHVQVTKPLILLKGRVKINPQVKNTVFTK